MPTAGAVWIDVLPSLRGFGPQLSRQTSRASRNAGDQAGRTFGSRFSAGMSSPVKKAAAGLAGAFAAVQVGGFLKDAVGQASDLSETVSKVTQVFGPAAAEVMKFSDSAATSLGQTKQQALDANATFGIFGKSAGLSGDQLSGFTTKFTTLASDMASFNNTTPEEAITAIGAALRGESEPIRAYGVLLDDASLRAEALKQGLVKTTKEALTPQQKVLASSALIMKQTTLAQGDFARTSDGLANKTRILTAQWNGFKTQIGTAILPLVLRVTQVIGPLAAKVGTAGAAFGKSEGFRSFGDTLKTRVLPAVRAFADYAVSRLVPAGLALAKEFRENVVPVLRDLGGFLIAEVIPKVQDLARIFVGEVVPAVAAVGRAVLEIVGFLHQYQDIVVPLAAAIGAYIATIKTVAAVTAAYKAVQQAYAFWTYSQAASTGVLATATGALNAMFWANPIGIVVAALVALGVGLFVAYKKSETFRKIVDGAFRAVKAAASAVLDFFRDHWKVILALLTGPIGIAVALVIRHWDTIKGVFSAGVRIVVGIVSSIVDFLTPIFRVIRGLFQLYVGIWKLIITKAFGAIKAVVTLYLKAVWTYISFVLDVVKRIWQAAWGAIQRYIIPVWNAIRNTVTSVFNAVSGFISSKLDAVKRTWTSVWNGIKQVVSTVWGAVETRIQTAMDKVTGIITKAKDVIGAAWGKVTDVVKKPISDLFGWINDHLINNINGVTGKFTKDLQIPPLPTGFAAGGHVRGPGGPRSDSIPARLSNGEFVVQAAAVNRYGVDMLDAVNSMRFAGGGLVDKFKKGAGKAGSIAKAGAGKVKAGVVNAADFGADIVKYGVREAAERVLNPIRNAMTDAWGGKGILIDTPLSVMTKLIDAVVNWGAQQQTTSASGAPGGAAPAYQGQIVFPLPAGSYMTGAGYPRYPSGRRHTGQDFPAPVGTPIRAPFSGWFSQWDLGNRSYGHAINLVAGALRFIGGHTSGYARGDGMVNAGDVLAYVGSSGNSTGPHLHAEFRENGSIQDPRRYLSFDQGGKLPPGLNLVHNGTGRPETVLNPRQEALLGKALAGSSPNVQVIIDGREVEYAVVRVSERRDAAFANGMTYRAVAP